MVSEYIIANVSIACIRILYQDQVSIHTSYISVVDLIVSSFGLILYKEYAKFIMLF